MHRTICPCSVGLSCFLSFSSWSLLAAEDQRDEFRPRPLQNRMEWDCFMHRLRSIRINVNQSKKNLRWPEPIEKVRIKKRNADMHLLPEV